MSCPVPSREIILSSTVAALLLSEGLTKEELNYFGNLMTAIGAQLLTIAAGMDLDEARTNQGPHNINPDLTLRVLR